MQQIKETKNKLLHERLKLIILDSSKVTVFMFVPIIGLMLIGHDIDFKFGTNPAFTLIGILIGVLVSFKLILKYIKGLNE